MYSNRKMFETYLTKEIVKLKEAQCPSHFECGQQDAWIEQIEASLISAELALELVINGYDHYGTDKDKFQQSTEAYKHALTHFIADLNQDLSDSLYENEMYFDEYYHQVKVSGSDLIS